MTKSIHMNGVSIGTPFNSRKSRAARADRRVLVNGRWQRVDPAASSVLGWLRDERLETSWRLSVGTH